MKEKEQTQQENKRASFEERYQRLSDQEINDILVKRKHYQEVAVEVAVEEAIKRGIIHSEQDLFGPDFLTEEHKSSRFFPIPEKPYFRDRLQASLSRLAYVLGAIPIVSAFLRSAEGISSDVYLHGAAGLLWIALNFWFYKTKKALPGQIMFTLLCVILVFVCYQTATAPMFKVMDGLVIVVVFGVAFYSLIFALKIVSQDR